MKFVTITKKSQKIKIPESYEEFLSLSGTEKFDALKYQDENPEEFKRDSQVGYCKEADCEGH